MKNVWEEVSGASGSSLKVRDRNKRTKGRNSISPEVPFDQFNGKKGAITFYTNDLLLCEYSSHMLLFKATLSDHMVCAKLVVALKNVIQ